MDKQALKALVAEMLQEMGQTVPPEPTVKSSDYKPTEETNSATQLEDITAINLQTQYLVEKPENEAVFRNLKKKTPARLGVGKAGPRYKTITALRFQADHAAAQDSVFSHVPPSFWEDNHLTFVQTKCSSKDEYLTRPDLGRRFDDAAAKTIQQLCGSHPKIVLVIGDGLSSNAIVQNAMDCAAAIIQGLKNYHLETTPPLFVQYCRVGASDHIGDLTGCDVVCMLVGERPGLVTSESMSAYITYRPHIGIPESSRTVVSNIHRQGTPAVEAGAHIAQLLHTILEKKASGVQLTKEVSA